MSTMPPYKAMLSLFLSWNFIIYTINGETVICTLGTECNCNPVMDHPEPCSLQCNTTDVCKGKTLNCRAGDTCLVLCEGYASCSETIIESSAATNVSLTCDGTDSCKDMSITCGSGDCTLQCDTYNSCIEVHSINATLANSFQCKGACEAENIPQSSFAPLATMQPTALPTSNPTIEPTSSLPTTQPSVTSSLDPILSTSVSTSNPTLNLSSSQPLRTTQKPTSNPVHHAITSVVPTAAEKVTLDEFDKRVDAPSTTTSHLSTLQMLFQDDVEIRYVHQHAILSTLCYLVIGAATFIVICVCLLASGLVYINHKNTQQILLAATQTYKANSERNKQHPPLPRAIPSLNQLQSPSFILNPYQMMNQVPYTPQNMTPNMNALTPNFAAMTPVIRQTVSAISVNNDAISVNNVTPEGTETHTNRRHMSDIPALPHTFGTASRASIHRGHIRQRASIHMTPAGYMDDDFVTTKKRTMDDFMPGKEVVRSPDVLRNNSNANSIIMNTTDTNHIALEVLNLGQETQHKDMNADRMQTMHVALPQIGKKAEAESMESKESNTEDLSRELFTTNSESHSRNVSLDVVPPNRAIWYQYHQVGSLPVINAAAVHTKRQNRAQSVSVLMKKKIPINNIMGEPLQLPALVNNNLVPPTDTESTYDSGATDPRLDEVVDDRDKEEEYGEMEHEESYVDGFESDLLQEIDETYPSRVTNSALVNKSATDDTDVVGDDDTYFEMKPLVESSIHTEHTEYDSLSSFVMEESETSMAKDCGSGDSIILQHADTLMQLLSNNDITEHESLRKRSSISFGV